MPVVRRAESRRTETPNAVMTTLASPTQGGAGQSVWRVDMRPGQAGPRHAIDTEQIWTVLDGGASVEIDGQVLTIGPGDTLILPAELPRRVSADPAAGFAAIVAAPAGARAYVVDADQAPAGRAVSDADKLVPAWVA
jgi:quercetin dioxygenase-like cupin family protein